VETLTKQLVGKLKAELTQCAVSGAEVKPRYPSPVLIKLCSGTGKS
jgi:hypothetical protein